MANVVQPDLLEWTQKFDGSTYDHERDGDYPLLDWYGVKGRSPIRQAALILLLTFGLFWMLAESAAANPSEHPRCEGGWRVNGFEVGQKGGVASAIADRSACHELKAECLLECITDGIRISGDNLHNDCHVGVLSAEDLIRRDVTTVVCRTPVASSWRNVRVSASASMSDANKWTAKQADIFKVSDIEGSRFPKISHAVVPPQLFFSEIKPDTVVRLWVRNYGWVKRENRLFVEAKVKDVRGKLLLHRAELTPEHPSSYASEACAEYCSDGSKPGSTSFRRGFWVLGILDFCAIVCGVAAYQLNYRWPNTGWIPLAIFFLIAVIACLQLSHLTNEIQSANDARYVSRG